MSFIELTKVVETSPPRSAFDDLERPVAVEPTIETSPIMINVKQIREFYRRRHDKPGTRITLLNGAGIPVTEPYEEVKAAVEAAVGGNGQLS